MGSILERMPKLKQYCDDVATLIHLNGEIDVDTEGIKLLVYCRVPNKHRSGNITRLLWYPDHYSSDFIRCIPGYLPRIDECLYERGKRKDILERCYPERDKYVSLKDDLGLLHRMALNTVNRLVHKSFRYAPSLHYLGERTS